MVKKIAKKEVKKAEVKIEKPKEESKTIIIDATDLLLGRLASSAAKSALEGKEVFVINAEKAVVSGNRENILADYRHKRERGDLVMGPFFPKAPDRLVRRTIRGMLPFHRARGREAFRRIHVYIGKPIEIKGPVLDLKKHAEMARLKDQKFIRIEEISRDLGASW